MRWGIWLISIVAVAALASQATADDPPPTTVVKHLNESLLDVLKQAEQLGYQGRFDRLAPVLEEAFDFDYMARQCVGRSWRTLSQEEQAEWLKVFARFTTANYAGRFDRYSGQRFDVIAQEPSSGETVLVRTKVVNPGDEDVDLRYRLHQTGVSWKIIDVYLKGTVSELALRRSEYSSVLKRQGFDALISTINGKIAALVAGDGKP